MAKATGKLMKLKSALKKINSFGNKLSRSNSALSGDESTDRRLQTVYVGRSKREYRVDPEVMDHPVMQQLMERSNGCDEISVGCEVVLFDHLRWMIENSDPQLEPLDGLAGFYAY